LTIDYQYRDVGYVQYLAAVVVISAIVAALAAFGPRPPEYGVTSDITRSFGEIAAQSDFLILGEFHGTQEMPALAASLLTPLTKLGYNVLALEVPSDQQVPLTAWAMGKTTKVPSFFTRQGSDWKFELDLPHATPATFLAPPADDRPLPTKQ
jgi:hypothetical protein